MEQNLPPKSCLPQWLQWRQQSYQSLALRFEQMKARVGSHSSRVSQERSEQRPQAEVGTELFSSLWEGTLFLSYRGQPGLHSEVMDSQGYTERP